MQTCTSRAPESRSCPTMRRHVVPRTMESSITIRRFPSILYRIGESLMRTESSRISFVGWMKVRPMYLFLISPSP